MNACGWLALGEFFQHLHPDADICVCRRHPFPVRLRRAVLPTGRVPLSSEPARHGAACQWHSPKAGAREGHLRGAWALRAPAQHHTGHWERVFFFCGGGVGETARECPATALKGWGCPGGTLGSAVARVPDSSAGRHSPATAVGAEGIAARLGLGGELDRLFLVLLAALTAAAPRCRKRRRVLTCALILQRWGIGRGPCVALTSTVAARGPAREAGSRRGASSVFLQTSQDLPSFLIPPPPPVQ